MKQHKFECGTVNPETPSLLFYLDWLESKPSILKSCSSAFLRFKVVLETLDKLNYSQWCLKTKKTHFYSV